jgi:hypothetical protein
MCIMRFSEADAANNAGIMVSSPIDFIRGVPIFPPAAGAALR